MKKKTVQMFLIVGLIGIVSLSKSTSRSAECEEFIRPDLIPTIEQIASDYCVSPELIEAMIETESCGIPTVSNGSCYGLMQVSTVWHSKRASALGVDMTTEAGNIRTGVDYLMELAEDSDDLYYVLGTYNGQSNAAEGVPNAYATKIMERAEQLEYIHGKRAYEVE